MHKYEIIIYWSDDDKAFIAEVPELPGCAAHGNSPDSALTNCQDAIDLWIKTAIEFGRPVPEPKGRKLQYAQDAVEEPLLSFDEVVQDLRRRGRI